MQVRSNEKKTPNVGKKKRNPRQSRKIKLINPEKQQNPLGKNPPGNVAYSNQERLLPLLQYQSSRRRKKEEKKQESPCACLDGKKKSREQNPFPLDNTHHSNYSKQERILPPHQNQSRRETRLKDRKPCACLGEREKGIVGERGKTRGKGKRKRRRKFPRDDATVKKSRGWHVRTTKEL